MSRFVDTTQEVEAEGQLVIITARWILIVGALALTLWNPGGVTDLWKVQAQAGLLLIYAVVNFFLHAQYLRQGGGLSSVAYLTSAIDLTLISFVVLIQGQVDSAVFVFYMPALFALSVAFPKRTAVTYTVLLLAGYAFVSLAGQTFVSQDQFQELIVRMIMMAGVAFVGGLFKHIEGERASGRAKPFTMTGGRPRATRGRTTGTADQAQSEGGA